MKKQCIITHKKKKYLVKIKIDRSGERHYDLFKKNRKPLSDTEYDKYSDDIIGKADEKC